MLKRKTRNAVLSVSRKACPFMDSSGAADKNIYANLKINPNSVNRMFKVFGTCDAHMNSNPFPMRLFSRAKSALHRVKRRCNTIANHGHHYN